MYTCTAPSFSGAPYHVLNSITWHAAKRNTRHTVHVTWLARACACARLRVRGESGDRTTRYMQASTAGQLWSMKAAWGGSHRRTSHHIKHRTDQKHHASPSAPCRRSPCRRTPQVHHEAAGGHNQSQPRMNRESWSILCWIMSLE
jgi:hypothetical protein